MLFTGNIVLEKRRQREAVIRALTAMGISYIREMKKPLHAMEAGPDPYLSHSKKFKEVKYHRKDDKVYVVLPEITLSRSIKMNPKSEESSSALELQDVRS